MIKRVDKIDWGEMREGWRGGDGGKLWDNDDGWSLFLSWGDGKLWDEIIKWS